MDGGIVLDFTEEALTEAIVDFVKPQYRKAFFPQDKA